VRQFLSSGLCDPGGLLYAVKLTEEPVDDFELFVLRIELTDRLDNVLLDAQDIRLYICRMQSHSA
jgi:hypothetical protein